VGTWTLQSSRAYIPLVAGDLHIAATVIRGEYERLREKLGLQAVPLDIYQADENAAAEEATPLGSPLRNATPCYSGCKRIMILPLCDGDDWPSHDLDFPPAEWSKYGVEWPMWRIELWHEFVHQVSDDVHRGWSPKEPGRRRPDGSMSDKGHGAGWFDGVRSVAAAFGVDPENLDRLLDR